MMDKQRTLRVPARAARTTDDRGAVAIIVAVFVIVAMVLLAFVVDRGRAYVAQSQLQNAVDAAALAAGPELCDDNVLAARLAQQYAEGNGFSQARINVNNVIVDVSGALTPAEEASFAAGPTRISGSAYVNVRAADEIRSFFPFAGTENAATAAQATVRRLCPIIGYSIFNGSTTSPLVVNANGVDVTGGIHSNNDINVASNNNDFEGVSVVGDFTASGTGTTTDGTPNEDAVVETMADYAARVGLDTQTSASVLAAATLLAGNQTFSSTPTPGTNVYVTGTATVSVQNTTWSHSLFADGNITVSGNNVTFGTADAPVIIYSRTGNISLNAQGLTVYGIVYAPQGTVTLNTDGDGGVVGSVVADQVGLNGQNYSVVYPDPTADPAYDPRLIQ